MWMRLQVDDTQEDFTQEQAELSLPRPPCLPAHADEHRFRAHVLLLLDPDSCHRSSTFLVVAPHWWNAFSSELRTAPSLETV